MTDHGEGSVRVYYGASSYSSQAALRKLGEPHVMLSAQTQARKNIWDGIEDLFVDSGGYSLMLNVGEHPPIAEYIETVRQVNGDKFALQDFPCEPNILDKYDRSVQQHQSMTTEHAAEGLAYIEDNNVDATPMSVLQGWETDDYIRHVDQLQDAGALTEHVGIGSVCRRGQIEEIREIIRAVSEALPNGHKIHAFGVKYEILRDPGIREILNSVDTSAWYIYPNQHGRLETEPLWQAIAFRYLQYWRKVESLWSNKKVDRSADDHQKTLVEDYDQSQL